MGHRPCLVTCHFPGFIASYCTESRGEKCPRAAASTASSVQERAHYGSRPASGPTVRVEARPPRRRKPTTWEPTTAFTRPRGGVRSQVLVHKRAFHDYFITHLPSSSLHPDSRSSYGPHHKFPRSASEPHTAGWKRPPAALPLAKGLSRDLTVVRIPLESAKYHFGISTARGTRPCNEDTYKAGVIEIPAFARRAPVSLTRSAKDAASGGGGAAGSAGGDPQCFYFGVFDGHGGSDCSAFLREQLHTYIEGAARKLGLPSSLPYEDSSLSSASVNPPGSAQSGFEGDVFERLHPQTAGGEEETARDRSQAQAHARAMNLQHALVASWAETIGGYFKRFYPEQFRQGRPNDSLAAGQDARLQLRRSGAEPAVEGVDIESVLTYAFLQADFDFVVEQAKKLDEDIVRLDRALNEDEILGQASRKAGGPKARKFTGGSTCSVAMVSTPTPTPFWNPSTPSTLMTSHVGDTRILLCSTANGRAVALTTNHHPSATVEGRRLRRFAASFVTDAFGDERVGGLANTRAFGDLHSKPLGVSAEPEIRRVELQPAEFSFLVLMSDGISGLLGDQEIVDIVKESRTPEQGAKDVVGFATEVSSEGDNATCMVIRLGGWERRGEGGGGSLSTKEIREWRRQEAAQPRNRRQ